jgi:branched-chain amino acid transport system substrate-binding protein
MLHFLLLAQYRASDRPKFLKRLARTAALALAVFVGVSAPALAGDLGVSADAIVFGQSAPLTGPASVLGLQMRDGILAAFDEVNRQGGVGGRQLKLVSYDDGYEPDRAIEMTRRLIEQDKVFALIGQVGTPTATATEPMATKAGLPFIGALTGAEFLRGPWKTNVVNIRASYFQETEALIGQLTADRSLYRIAVLYQDDAFGRAGLAGVEAALGRRGIKLVGKASFERNTTAIKMATLALRQDDPQAVVIVGTYKPAAAFVKLAGQLGMNVSFASLSFLGSDAFAKEAGEAAVGTIISQVTPSPKDVSLPLVARFHQALKAYDPSASPTYLTLEGYVTGRLTIAALEKIAGEPSRDAFLAAVHGATFDFGGMTLSYGDFDNRGSNRVFLTVIDADGSARPIAKLTEPRG